MPSFLDIPSESLQYHSDQGTLKHREEMIIIARFITMYGEHAHSVSPSTARL